MGSITRQEFVSMIPPLVLQVGPVGALADASGHFAGVLVVKNEWGDRTAKAFSCTASDDDDAAAPSAR